MLNAGTRAHNSVRRVRYVQTYNKMRDKVITVITLEHYDDFDFAMEFKRFFFLRNKLDM